jgi:anaerobic ribonucleoside-triphosphate reductase activating protein
MNIAAIQFPVFTPYKLPTVEIYVSGCTNYCTDCHNEELWDFNYGEKLNIEKLLNYLLERQDLFDCISILGGDLLCQDESDAVNLMWNLHFYFKGKKEFWLFTGKDSFPEWCNNYFDYIKLGKYIPELTTAGFPSSSNQQLIKIK